MTLTDITKFDQYMLVLLIAKIKNTKSQYDTLINSDNTMMMGGRYHDDRRIAHMVIGDIFTECSMDYQKANTKFISLNSIEIEPYIKKAVLDSAGADYWYLYEKQWN